MNESRRKGSFRQSTCHRDNWGVQCEECQECEECDLGLVVQKRLRKKQKSCTSVPRAVWAGRSSHLGKTCCPSHHLKKQSCQPAFAKYRNVKETERERERWRCAGAMYDSITEHLLIMLTTCNIFNELLWVNKFLWNLKRLTFGALLARSLRWKREEGVQGASTLAIWSHDQPIIKTVLLARHNFCIFFQAEVKIVKTPQAMDLSF